MINLLFNNFYISFIFSLFFITIMTSLGSAFVFFIKENNLILINVLLGISSGIMLSSAIFSLIVPAINYSSIYIVSVGIIIGVLFLIIVNKILNNEDNTIIMIISIVLHNIPEGAIIGIAYGSIFSNNASIASSLALAIGIGIQNIPEGTAIAIPILKNGSKFKAFILGALSGIVEPISAVLGFLMVTKITSLLPLSEAIAAGSMLYITIYELIPTSQSNNKNLITFFTILGFIMMLILEAKM